MSDTDSVVDSPPADAGAQTTDQTSASQPATPPSSESERINGLMRAMGHKETERQDALRERDAAQAALVEMQALLDTHGAGTTEQAEPEAAPAQAAPAQDYDPDADEYEPEPVAPPAPPEPPALHASASAPRSASLSATPRMTEADRALSDLNKAFSDHMNILNNRLI